MRITLQKLKLASRGMAYLLRHPRSFRYAYTWINSNIGKHSSLDGQVPWITFQATDWLESILNPNMVIFEYGSGGSTIFLAKRIKKLISVEHDEKWYQRVSDVLRREHLLNCEYILTKPKPIAQDGQPPHTPIGYNSQVERYRYLSFEPYVKSIDKYPDGVFDLVFIDGRARSWCVEHALKKIRPGGYLMLDNSERERYQKSLSPLKDGMRMTFTGLAPYNLDPSQTSVWKIR